MSSGNSTPPVQGVTPPAMPGAPAQPAAAPSRIRKPAGRLPLTLGILSLALSMMCGVGLFFGIGGVIAFFLGRKTPRDPEPVEIVGAVLSCFGILSSLIMLAVGGGFFMTIRGAMPGDGFKDWRGIQAPDFQVQDMKGKSFRLSEYRGRPVVLDFWATWCGPCRKMSKNLARLAREAPEVAILGITDEDKDTIQTFLDENGGAHYPLASVAHLPEPYDKVDALPTLFYIDRTGTIRDVVVGYEEYEAVREKATATGAPR